MFTQAKAVKNAFCCQLIKIEEGALLDYELSYRTYRRFRKACSPLVRLLRKYGISSQDESRDATLVEYKKFKEECRKELGDRSKFLDVFVAAIRDFVSILRGM